MGKPSIYCVPAEREEPLNALQDKIRLLLNKAGLHDRIRKNDLVAVKMHFGEKGNTTSIPPEWVKPVVDEIKSCSARPFLTDTCVLYRSVRDNAVGHLEFARGRGFTEEATGAPVVIADGITGSDERVVPVAGRIFKEVSVAGAARDANALVVLTHVTGHMVTGLGGAIKNLGMGFASRKGKLRQHATLKPNVTAKFCTGCGVCVAHCPSDAIAMEGGKARIDHAVCIGCGECLASCRFDAIKHDWNRDSADLQRRMTEHALGAVTGRQDRAVYLNFAMALTKDCDCMSFNQKPVLPDLGILAGTDPVAVDAASLEWIRLATGRDLAAVSYPALDPWVQIRHGEEVGLGSSAYERVEAG